MSLLIHFGYVPLCCSPFLFFLSVASPSFYLPLFVSYNRPHQARYWLSLALDLQMCACSWCKSICRSFGFPAFSSSIIVQIVSCGSTASSVPISNVFSTSFPSVLNPLHVSICSAFP